MAKRKKRRSLTMRKVREVLRLGLKCRLSNREIARSCAVSHVTAGKYISQAQKAKLTYEAAMKMDDTALLRLLGKDKIPENDKKSYPLPDCNYIHKELKKKSVTLQLLWEEYKSIYPDGYQSTQFCELYMRWKKKLSPSLYQVYKAGDKMFVDYAGQTIPIKNPHTGETKEAQIFVAVLGASNYTYSEATWDQALPSWIGSHVRAFEYFSGAANVTVPDNLKSGVSKACRYEPDINPTYHDMAVHYGTIIAPARAAKPKDKAKVESGVLVVERWILAALRNRTFFSLYELNQAIKELLVKLNEKPFKKLDGCRKAWFENIEKSALLPLPANPYIFAEWKKVKVNIDYHVDINGHYYSVPCSLGTGTGLEARSTKQTVEIFHNDRRIVSHLRDDTRGRHTTVKEHMPKSHRQYLEWSPSRIINWAKSMGDATSKVVETILTTRKHPEQGYRSCLGILRLAKKFSKERLEAACERALIIRSYSYKSVESILKNGLDKQKPPKTQNHVTLIHQNIRGSAYFTTDYN